MTLTALLAATAMMGQPAINENNYVALRVGGAAVAAQEQEGLTRAQGNIDFLRAGSPTPFYATFADALLNKLAGGKVNTKPGVDPVNAGSKDGYDMVAGAYRFKDDTAASSWNNGKTVTYVAFAAGNKAERVSLTVDTYEFSKNKEPIKAAIEKGDMGTLVELLAVCRPLDANKKQTNIAEAFVWDSTSPTGKKAAPAGGTADTLAKAINDKVAGVMAWNIGGQNVFARINKPVAPMFAR